MGEFISISIILLACLPLILDGNPDPVSGDEAVIGLKVRKCADIQGTRNRLNFIVIIIVCSFIEAGCHQYRSLSMCLPFLLRDFNRLGDSSGGCVLVPIRFFVPLTRQEGLGTR